MPRRTADHPRLRPVWRGWRVGGALWQSGFSYLTAVLRESWQPTLYPSTSFNPTVPGWLGLHDKTGDINEESMSKMLLVWLGSLRRREQLLVLGRKDTQSPTENHHV